MLVYAQLQQKIMKPKKNLVPTKLFTEMFVNDKL